jgi:hypothetical protein
MSNFRSYREESRTNWGTHLQGGLSIEQINCGSFLRIADAMEKMAVNHIKLQEEYEYMKRQRDDYRSGYELWKKRAAALKGQIIKLKNKQK